MADIFEEISQDVQQEKLLAFWKKHQKTLSSLVTGVIVIAAIISYWLYRQQEIREEASSDYTAALLLLSTGQPDKALKHLESMPQKTGHIYADLAKFLGAGILTDKGNTHDAMESYQALIDSTSFKELKDLATIKLLTLQIDTGDMDQILPQLDPFLKEGNPWYFIAMELKGLGLLKQEKTEEAKAVFQLLKENDKAPHGLKLRTSFLLSHLKHEH